MDAPKVKSRSARTGPKFRSGGAKTSSHNVVPTISLMKTSALTGKEDIGLDLESPESPVSTMKQRDTHAGTGSEHENSALYKNNQASSRDSLGAASTTISSTVSKASLADEWHNGIDSTFGNGMDTSSPTSSSLHSRQGHFRSSANDSTMQAGSGRAQDGGSRSKRKSKNNIRTARANRLISRSDKEKEGQATDQFFSMLTPLQLANAHNYLSQADGWKETNTYFAGVTDADQAFVEKLYNESMPGCVHFLKKYKRSIEDALNDEKGNGTIAPESLDAKAYELSRTVGNACILPPPMGRMMENWDLYEEDSHALMKTISGCGGCDERLGSLVQDVYLDKAKPNSLRRHLDSNDHPSPWILDKQTATSSDLSPRYESQQAIPANKIHPICHDPEADAELLQRYLAKWPVIEKDLGAFDLSSTTATSSDDKIANKNRKRNKALNMLFSRDNSKRRSDRVLENNSEGKNVKKKRSSMHLPLHHRNDERFGTISNDFKSDESLRLGKRRRFYREVWDEEDFLFHTKQGKLFSEPLDDWVRLLPNSSDNHEGYYREFMLENTPKRDVWSSALSKDGQGGTARKARHRAKLELENRNSGEKNYVQHIAPPVPVSAHHPACWGMNSRDLSTLLSSAKKGADKTPYEYVHPASHTTYQVPTPGFYIDDDVDDVDDLNLELDRCQKVLCNQDAKNFLYLHDLVDASRRALNVRRMRDRRITRESSMYSIYKVLVGENSVQGGMNAYPLCYHRADITPTSSASDGLTTVDSDTAVGEENSVNSRNEVKAAPLSMWKGDDRKNPTENLDSVAISPSSHISTANTELVRHLDVEEASTPCVLPPGKVGSYFCGTDLLGACLVEHVPHGSFVRDLHIGDQVEMLSFSGTWTLGEVVARRMDGHLLRHIKVQAMDSFPGDCSWIAAEDGRLAPIGTHTYRSRAGIEI